MKHYSFILLSFIFISGCSFYFVPTKQFANIEESIKTIGYVDCYNYQELDSVYAGTNAVYKLTLEKTFLKQNFESIKYVNENINYLTPDSDIIQLVCQNYNCDAIIVSDIILVASLDFQPPNVIPLIYYEVVLKTKLFDKNGKLLFQIKKNTTLEELHYIRTINMNSTPNSTTRLIHNSTKIIAKKIIKKIRQ